MLDDQLNADTVEPCREPLTNGKWVVFSCSKSSIFSVNRATWFHFYFRMNETALVYGRLFQSLHHNKIVAGSRVNRIQMSEDAHVAQTTQTFALFCDQFNRNFSDPWLIFFKRFVWSVSQSVCLYQRCIYRATVCLWVQMKTKSPKKRQ